MSDIKTLIASFIKDLSYEDLSESTITIAKKAVLDFFANIIAGFDSEASIIARSFASFYNYTGDITVFGAKEKYADIFAVFCNAIAASDMDADDGNREAMGHPGAVIIPTSIALAEKNKINGREIILSIVVGYEIGIRIGIIANRTCYSRFIGSGNWASYGATAAAANIMGLDRSACINALGICESHTPVAPMEWMFKQQYAMTKEAMGWGALTGLSSSYLAKEGMSGNFLQIDGNEDVFIDLASKYKIEETYFKRYSSCRYTHPAIECVLDLKKKNNFSIDDIKKIIVNTFIFASQLDSASPSCIQEAEYSLPFTISAALVFGDVKPEYLKKNIFNRHEIIELSKKISVNVDSKYEDSFPKQTGCQVCIALNNGKKYSKETTKIKGDYLNPLSVNDIAEKFKIYSEAKIKNHTTVEMIEAINRLENLKSINNAISVLNSNLILN